MLDELKNQFIRYLESQKKARATIVAYAKDIDQLVTNLKNSGKSAITTVTEADLSLFLEEMRGKNFTPKTISRKINSIKTFYRFLKEKGVININIADALSHPKYELKAPRILSKLEYRALRDVCRSDPRTYAIIELFLQTGLRISEVANLTMSDIQDNFIAVDQRKIPLNEKAHEALSNYVSIRPEKGENTHVFITKSGKNLLIRNIRTAIDRALKVAGIENAKVNDLRATFIAHQLSAGAPLDYISKLVGHKRISTTERYIGLVQEKPKRGAKTVEL